MEQPKTIIKIGDYYEVIPKETSISQNFLTQKELEQQIMETKLLQNPNIDATSVSPSSAFKSLLETENNIYSLYSSNPSKKSPYPIETPQEKINRLKLEIAELQEDLQMINDKNIQIEDSEKLGPDITLSQIKELQQQLLQTTQYYEKSLNQLTPEAIKKFNLDFSLAVLKKDLQENISKNILRQIEHFKSNLQEVKSDNQAQTNYKIELYLDQQQETLDQLSKFHNLENRIAKIEQLLGQDQLLKVENENFNLIQRTQHFEKSIDIIKNTQNVYQQINQIVTEIEKIQSKKEEIKQLDVQTKINYLYDKFNAVQGIADSLPVLVSRMEALKQLHEESASFMTTMQYLVDNHNKIIASLHQDQELVKLVEQNFLKNLTIVQQNLQNLESRIEKLTKHD